LFASFGLEISGMILLLLPPMAVLTLVAFGAAVMVGGDEFVGVRPVDTEVFAIVIQRWLPAIVLPIVGIYAGSPVVRVLLVGAPHSLEMEYVEVHVWHVLLNQIDRDVVCRMSEGAKLFVLAFLTLY
jgi:hypothetical protein